MQNIAIISKSNLAWEGTVKILQDEFPEYHVTSYCIDQNKNFLYFQQKFDLIIVDIGERIFDFVLPSSDHNVKIAVITTEVERDVTDLFKLGLNGYLSSGMDIKELIHAIKHILRGHCYIPPSLTSILIEEYVKIYKPIYDRPQGLLTNREWEMLEYIAYGYSNKQIAEQLLISSGTAKNHIISLFTKLNVNDRTNAVIKAIKNGWVNIY